MDDIKFKIKYKIASSHLPLRSKLSNICPFFYNSVLKNFISSVDKTLKSKLPTLLHNLSCLLNNYNWIIHIDVDYGTQNLANYFSIQIRVSSYDKKIENLILSNSYDNIDAFTCFLNENNFAESYCTFLSSLSPEEVSFKYLFSFSNKAKFYEFNNLYQNLHNFIDEINSKNLISNNQKISISNISFIIEKDIKWKANYKIYNSLITIDDLKEHIASFGTTGKGLSNFIKYFMTYYTLKETSTKTFLESLMHENIVSNEYINEITDDNVFEILELTKLLNY